MKGLRRMALSRRAINGSTVRVRAERSSGLEGFLYKGWIADMRGIGEIEGTDL
jgi:hypothetical protein